MKWSGLFLAACLVLPAGCGKESLGDKANRTANAAGQVFGEGASSFVNGVGEGIDKTVTSYDVRLSGELKALGVSVTVAKRSDNAASSDGKQVLSFYILNKSAVSADLRLRLFNDKAQEIGRSTEKINFAADDARYVPFSLDKDMPILVTRYVEIDLRKPLDCAPDAM